MLSTFTLFATSVYIVALFLVARFARGESLRGRGWVNHSIVYALSLGVYCTSWTFYGLVGTAADSGWDFSPILLGPILLFTFGFPIISRIAHITRREKLRSITDFVSSRYGKRRGIAVVVTLVLFVATVPYIALQLKAVSDSLQILLGRATTANIELTVITSVSMIAFALLFGSQSTGHKQYNAGLIVAVAFESFIKLIAMAAVAVLAVMVVSSGDASGSLLGANAARASQFSEFNPSISFFVQMFISACMMFCLPRMFHVCFVENHSESQLRSARWIFAGYLLLLGLFIVVIASVGNQLYGASDVQSDHFMLAIPMGTENSAVGILAFMGGFSAATAMIIVATITLSQIISNDIVFPVVFERDKAIGIQRDYSRTQVYVRRISVVCIIALAYFYQHLLANNLALTSIGLIAFALAVQLAPTIVAGIYSRRSNAYGAYAGITAGSLVWLYTLFVPMLSRAGFGLDSLVASGPFGIELLKPENIFGLGFSDSYSRGVILSLLVNVLFFVLVSRRSQVKLIDRIQARMFAADGEELSYGGELKGIRNEDLRALMTQFVGQDWIPGMPESGDEFASRQVIEQAEKTLTGITGVATARSLLTNINPGGHVNVEEVVSIVRDTTRALRFNQDMLHASFENVATGISVVNKELELSAWNKSYEKMFDLPPDYLHIGMPISKVVRYNAVRGMLGHGDVESLVQKRMDLLLQGNPYETRRNQMDGTIIEIKGRSLPNGGYVTTYDDITEFMQTQRDIERARDSLEQRVAERTETIESINRELVAEIRRRTNTEKALISAKSEAEKANKSKSEFLALASHDILQPLNAAKLFTDTLIERGSVDDLQTAGSIKSSLESASAIISTLMEIARLDTGALTPRFTHFPLKELFDSLISEYTVLLADNQEIHAVKTSVWVYTDKAYLRRILQNLLSNAIKYGEHGKILLACRRRGTQIELGVYDQGSGISDNEKELIFNDFYRAQRHIKYDGVGLGLSVTSRLTEMMGSRINLVSEPGRGSYFYLSIRKGIVQSEEEVVSEVGQRKLNGLRVLCLDDDHRNLEALQQLLGTWGCVVKTADDAATIFTLIDNGFVPDVAVLDYQLRDPETNGIQVGQELVRKNILSSDSISIVSAATLEDLPTRTRHEGFVFLSKPLKPAKLMAFLSSRGMGKINADGAVSRTPEDKPQKQTGQVINIARSKKRR